MRLSNKYSSDPELNMRKIPAIAYLPENLVKDSFKNLLQTEFYKNNKELLPTFINYFEDTYIICVNRGGQNTSSLFPIAI